MGNSRLYSEWGAFAGIPYQFIDNASDYPFVDFADYKGSTQ